MDKKQTSKTQATSNVQNAGRTNGVALTLALVFYLAATLGAIWMASNNTSWVWISLYIGVLFLIGTPRSLRDIDHLFPQFQNSRR